MNRSGWLTGPHAPCTPRAGSRRLNLVLLGRPGVGKGTQAALLAARLGPCHLSTGDLFRAATVTPAADRTPAVNQALASIARGELAADATVLGLVRERVACLRCPDGFLLDGFPRTEAQATALDGLLSAEGLALDAALCYVLDEERIVTRLAGRRVCPGCARVYHVAANPPAVEGTCDSCGTPVVPRADDRAEVVRVRMCQHDATAPPLNAYYAARGLLLTIPAEGTPDEVFALTAAALGAVPVR